MVKRLSPKDIIAQRSGTKPVPKKPTAQALPSEAKPSKPATRETRHTKTVEKPPKEFNGLEHVDGYVFGLVTNNDLHEIMPGWVDYVSVEEARFVYNYLRCGDRKAAITASYPKGGPVPNPDLVLLRKGVIKVMGMASRNLVGARFNEMRMRVTNMLWQRAFFDPSHYYNPDGTPAFSSWDEMPPEYRCVIDGIETKAYGKDAEKITTIKLASRAESLKMLADILQTGSLIADDETKMKLAHDDLRLLFDDNAKTFEDANQGLIEEPRIALEELKEIERRKEEFMAGNLGAEMVNPARLAVPSATAERCPAPNPADLLARVPTDLKEITKMAGELEGL